MAVRAVEGVGFGKSVMPIPVRRSVSQCRKRTLQVYEVSREPIEVPGKLPAIQLLITGNATEQREAINSTLRPTTETPDQ